jgi:N utilization substance protein A
MTSEFADAVRQFVQDKGIPNELIFKGIEEFLLAAYKKTFGTSDNAVVKINEEENGVNIYAQKMIVDEDDYYDPVSEIVLEEAQELNPQAEVGDELLIEIEPKEFDRAAIQSAKQRAKQYLRDIQKDTLYSEYKDKVNEIIIGYYQRERNGTIFVDLGKVEGILPRKNQSPRELYRPGDRIKSMIKEVVKAQNGLQIILSRRDPEFVKRLFDIEVPEIFDGTIEIVKIVREAGYRTKLAVRTHKDDVDPIGACVGLKGVRIQTIIKELEGERIDVLRYAEDPREFIKNSLSPAQVSQVFILDEEKKQALAVVPETQLSLAIGKQGSNVKLANRLADWSIDVKTEEQVDEMDLTFETRAAASELFGGSERVEEVGGLITKVSELDGVSERVVDLLSQNGLDLIEDIIGLKKEDLDKITGLTASDVSNLLKIIEENVEFIDEDEYDEAEDEEYQEEDYEEEAEEEQAEVEAEEEEEIYACPECGADITLSMTVCPSCGVGLSFEIEEEEEEPEDSDEEAGDSQEAAAKEESEAEVDD